MIRRVAGVVAFAAWAALAQNAAAPPAFEVASVKPTAPLAGSTGMPPRTLDDPGLVNYSSVTLKGVLCRAYDLQPDKIVWDPPGLTASDTTLSPGCRRTPQ